MKRTNLQWLVVVSICFALSLPCKAAEKPTREQYQKAVAKVTTMIAQQKDYRLYHLRANLYMKLGDYASAAADFKNAIANNPYDRRQKSGDFK